MSFPFWFDGLMAFMLFILLFVTTTRPKIPSTPQPLTIIVGIIAVLLLGLAPALEIVGTDRPEYSYMFMHADSFLMYGFKDIGFAYYLKLCDVLTGTDTGGFVISALIYVFATIYFCKKSDCKYLYMVLLCFLSWGFSNHHYNVLRAGLSIAFLLIAFSKDQKISIRVIFSLLAISFHISGLLIMVGYLATSVLKNTKILYLFWGVMLAALLVGVFDSFEQFSEDFTSMEDQRLNMYLSGEDRDYDVGLRPDFIIYSFFPILVGWYYVYKRKFKDTYYVHIYNTYIFCNACWLTISKMPANDRLAYMSWVFIPFILLYPILCNSKDGDLIRHKRLLLFGLTAIMVGLSFYLKYLR